MTATNGALTSQSTSIANMTFDEVSDVDDIVNASVSRPAPGVAALRWHRLRGVDGYAVRLRLPLGYSSRDVVRTTDNALNGEPYYKVHSSFVFLFCISHITELSKKK